MQGSATERWTSAELFEQKRRRTLQNSRVDGNDERACEVEGEGVLD